MKYQNYKLWLTVELDSVDYQRISAFIQTKLLNTHKARAKLLNVENLNFKKIDQILKDNSKLTFKMLGTYFIFPEYKDVLLKDTYRIKSKLSISEQIKSVKKEKIKYKSLMKLYVIRNAIMLSINKKEINFTDESKLTSKLINNINKVASISSDTIKSENNLTFNYGYLTKIKIKRSDSINSTSLLRFSTLMKKDNTIQDLKNFTLQSLQNKNLYELGYIEQL